MVSGSSLAELLFPLPRPQSPRAHSKWQILGPDPGAPRPCLAFGICHHAAVRPRTLDVLGPWLTLPRAGTACWPCRQRKVKCDNRSPCENCVKREHPQLCSYKPNRSAAKGGSAAPSEGSHHRKRPHSPDEQEGRSQSNEASEVILRAYGTYSGSVGPAAMQC
jgi:hypothetical protein